MTHRRYVRVVNRDVERQSDPHPKRRKFFYVPQAYDYRTKPRTPLEPSQIERTGRLVCTYRQLCYIPQHTAPPGVYTGTVPSAATLI